MSRFVVAFLSLVVWVAVSAGPAVAGAREIIWTKRAENAAQAQLAQEEFLLTLFNTGRLPFRQVAMGDRSTLEQVMREEGAWVGPMTERIATLLCEVNEGGCSQKTRAVHTSEIADQSKHVGGVVGADQRWTVQAGDTQFVRIPAIEIVQIAKPEPAGAGEKPTAKGIAISRHCLTEKICVDDYKAAGDPDAPQPARGVLRDVVVSDSNGLLLRLVPHLTAAISLSENPLARYQTLNDSRGIKFDFNDSGYSKFDNTLLKDIIGGIKPQLESHNGQHHGAFPDVEHEPLAGQQQLVLDRFCNKHTHGDCPELDAAGMFPIAVAVIDQVPDISHCDFGGNITILEMPDQIITGSTHTDTPADASCDRVLPAHQVLPEYHGTHVLGLLAAAVNHRGVGGLLGGFPNFSFVVIPFDEVDGSQNDTSLGLALSDAINRAVTTKFARVFNFSFSYRLPVDGSKDAVAEAIERWKDSVLFVAAAGKQGQNAEEGPCTALPACYSKFLDNVISVVALENGADDVKLLRDDDHPDRFLTNFGASIFNIGAPARDIVSTVGHNAFGPATGSSQAAPQVTAAAAILMARHNQLPREVRERLVYSSRLSNEASGMIQGGALDVTAALFSDHDWLHLADGCILKGDIRALHNTINGELTEGSFGMRFVSSGAVLHKRLADMRRLHWQDGTGIFFFDNGGRIERAVADFAINTEQHKLRMEVSEASSACGPQYVPHATVDVRLADVVDFIARKR